MLGEHRSECLIARGASCSHLGLVSWALRRKHLRAAAVGARRNHPHESCLGVCVVLCACIDHERTIPIGGGRTTGETIDANERLNLRQPLR